MAIRHHSRDCRSMATAQVQVHRSVCQRHNSVHKAAAMTNAEPGPSKQTMTRSEAKGPPVTVTFLGTCSGGGPIVSRNCSSLAVNIDGTVWLFDAADGTQLRLQQSLVKMSKISRIFITHLHADHVLGLVPLLSTIMSGVMSTKESQAELKKQGTAKKATMHIYGPAPLRALLRNTIKFTELTLGGAFACHELLYPGQQPSAGCSAQELLDNEAVGRDIYADDDGCWKNVVEGQGKEWGVGAGPIEHRVNSLGYVLQEPPLVAPLDTTSYLPILDANAQALASLSPPIKHPRSIISILKSTMKPYTLPDGTVLSPPVILRQTPRKLVIFGDCNGGTRNEAFEAMCADASLLVHECTNAWVPEGIEKGNKGRDVRVGGLEDSLVKKMRGKGCKIESEPPVEEDKGLVGRERERKEAVRGKAKSRGHSTPDEVGLFARNIRARRVVVNHFSAMFPSPHFYSCDAFPSLLTNASPHPCPVPIPPIKESSTPEVRPLPLTVPELHIRLILSSLSNQISSIWASPLSGATESFTLTDRPQEVDQHLDEHSRFSAPPDTDLRRAVTSRDFMQYDIPRHELTSLEVDTMRETGSEAWRVEREWIENGRVYIGEGEFMPPLETGEVE